MNKLLLILFSLIAGLTATPATASAKGHATHLTQVEPKKAYKAMLNVITYKEDGSVLHSGYGFFVQEDGVGVAAYSLFENAATADVFDYEGNKIPVVRILGASSTYDLVKFRVASEKKNDFFDLSQATTTQVGEKLLLKRYSTNKKDPAQSVTVTKADPYNKFKYYQISAENSAPNMGCPLYNEAGTLVAIVQQNVEDSAKEACAIDARFVQNLKINATSAINSDLRSIRIPKGLPDNAKDALTYIYMLGNADSTELATALNDFIAAYPDQVEGYVQRGTFFANHGQYDRCEADFTQALSLSENEGATMKSDEVHNELSKIIFQKAVYQPEPPYKDWTLDRALSEAVQAQTINPSPNYLLQQGRCLFSQKNFQGAYEKFYEICTTKQFDDNWSPQAQAETWFYAAQSLELAGGDSLQVLALMDSVIANLPTPLTPATAQYLLQRAQRLEKAGQYRKAVFDYNQYETVVGPKNLNAYFYFIREQAELKAHMYQQALDDIRTASNLSPENPNYKIEEALILLQTGLYDEAISVCEKLLTTLPENPDCYKIIGIANGELGHKEKAVTALNKAKSLGDPTVDSFLQKYQK